jgi:hypothetical protein
MSRAQRRSGSSVLLPWERQRAWLGELSSAKRWRSLLLVGVAVGLVLAAWSVADRRARVRSTRSAIAEVKRAVAAFRAEMDRCPKSKTELVHPPRAGAQYLTEIPTDGWGRDLLVRCPAPHDPGAAEVISAGPNGTFATDDNVF